MSFNFLGDKKMRKEKGCHQGTGEKKKPHPASFFALFFLFFFVFLLVSVTTQYGSSSYSQKASLQVTRIFCNLLNEYLHYLTHHLYQINQILQVDLDKLMVPLSFVQV